MNEVKRLAAATSLIAAACSVAFACTVSALQAGPPEKLPEELKPTWSYTYAAYAQEEEAEEPEAPAVETTPVTDLGEFVLTAYCTCAECCGEWADGMTYTGTEATAGRTVAVDPDVIPLGSTVYIDGAEYIAEDIGGAIKGRRIDVLLPTHEAALEFGVQYADVAIK